MAGSLVLLTVHGIGFQQPPTRERPGYADELHDHLRAKLGADLGEDPNRPAQDEAPDRKPGGPIYVRSEVDGSRDAGLARLAPDQPLVKEGRIAHVALVYSPSEPLGAQPGSTLDAAVRALLAHQHYTSALGALRMVLRDAWAALHETPAAETTSSLRPRTDPAASHVRPHAGPGPAAGDGDQPAGILRALEDDVATYVARNDLRERVRGFVEAALLALLDRPDVEGIVVNAHSHGTVVCWDVLCRLPFFSWQRGDGAAPDRRWPVVRALVTAGSPIRKYVDLFAWGPLVGQMTALIGRQEIPFAWSNFWDPDDPVADPLDPASAWRPGQPLEAHRKEDAGLLLARDPGGGPTAHVAVDEHAVDNVHCSAGGGLQAHDYWNNRTQFVAPLGQLLQATPTATP
jgi:hypothetical protein